MKNYLQVSFPLFLSLFVLMGITGCGGSEEEIVYDEKQESFLPEVDYDEFTAELKGLEQKILAQNPPDENLLKEATTKFQDFAGYFPEDPKAPDYLFKASDYALLLNQVDKSVKILQRIIDNYPNYNQMESVMFNKAEHLDLNLRDTTGAKIAYQEFIDKYPNSDLVDDAESRIKYISLSLEELADKFIKELESKPQ